MSSAAINHKLSAETSTGHSRYLEGLRGFAALWVVIGHLRIELLNTSTGWHWMQLLKFFDENLAVPVFIVLSGYLLAAPLAISRPWSGGVKFMERRLRRIYPAYLVAIIYSVALLYLVPQLRDYPTPRAPLVADATWPNIFRHLLMLHMGNASTQFSINPVMWSLVPEWWSYVFFAFVGAPLLAAKKGIYLLALLPMGFLCFYQFQRYNYDIFVAFWLGVGTAFFSSSASREKFESRIPDVLIGVILILLVGFFLLGPFDKHLRVRFYGAGVMGCILILLRTRPGRLGGLLQSCFQTRLSAWLGHISYSLYLIHFPLLSLFNSMAIHMHFSHPSMTSSFAIVFGLGSSFLVAQLFSKYVEYRFVKPRVAPTGRT